MSLKRPVLRFTAAVFFLLKLKNLVHSAKFRTSKNEDGKTMFLLVVYKTSNCVFPPNTNEFATFAVSPETLAQMSLIKTFENSRKRYSYNNKAFCQE